MNSNDLKLLKYILSLDQYRLKNTISRYLKDNYNNVIETQNYLCAIGSIPIVLVAHLDTVFQNPPKNIYYDNENKVMWSPEGLGADDRAGVFSILYLIKNNYRPSVIFTTNEELGCLGAIKLIKDYPNPFTNIKYIIELDRKGKNDCVFYDYNNLTFIEYIENFGFKESYGSFSDISVIGKQWKIASVNLSIGYFNEHNQTEFLNIDYMKNTISKVIKMLTQNDIPKFEYMSNTTDYFYFIKEQCNCCKKHFYSDELIPIQNNKNNFVYYCIDCIDIDDRIKFCENCGEGFQDIEDNKLCFICRDKGIVFNEY